MPGPAPAQLSPGNATEAAEGGRIPPVHPAAPMKCKWQRGADGGKSLPTRCNQAAGLVEFRLRRQRASKGLSHVIACQEKSRADVLNDNKQSGKLNQPPASEL